MLHHRFLKQKGFAPLSTAVATTPSVSAFVVCPAALSQGWMGQPCPWRHLYQLAYERAQAVVRPSRLERLQAVSWN
jgi:hypothetical protein